ncbi:MAG TPA: HD domain-containing protein [Vicinamibacterales bacterium]|jgi:[protein-PII] uridylyltransferase
MYGNAVAAALEDARRTLGRDIIAGDGGASVLRRYAAAVDREIQRLYAAANGDALSVALIALGGYGRHHLCPYSDIDLLVLFGGAIGAAEERFLRDLLHPLWDAGLVVGHQIREAGELAALEDDNPEFLLAVCDARHAAGDAALCRRLREAWDRPRTRARVLAALSELMETRHAQFAHTLYQLEPDVKESPGGLRDISAVRTIAEACDPSLLRRNEDDAARLDRAENFLLRIRALLHLERRRNDNVLSHELQEKIAGELGYPGQSPRQQVESLMADYFSHARGVARTLDRVRRTAPAPVGVNLGRTADGVRFIDEARAGRQPDVWLSAFQAAIDAGVAVADETLDCIRRHADGVSFAGLFPTAERATALLAFLAPRAGLYARLSEMHDCGLLERMIPPFRGVTCRVFRDFYHKYTVDEHTLQTIRNIERLVSHPEARPRFSGLLRELDAPEQLVLSLLLHDVGKWRDEDHAVESVRMAEGLLDQLQLSPRATETVLFLIRHHLRMSQVAFRRDTEDPEIVREFAALVGSEERLKLLCLMTLADVDAVSPETLTPWKEELLWRLYVDTYNTLTLQYGDDLIERTQSMVAACVERRPPDLEAGEIAAFLEGLPKRYLQLFDRRAVYEHVQLARDIHPDEVHLRLVRAETAWELTVVTLDKPMLFANICGVLSSFGMDILRGHAMTNPNGLVLDVFQFADAERFLALNPGASEAVLHALEEVVAGRSNVADRLRGRLRGLRRRPLPRVDPIVRIDGTVSRKYSVLEIVLPDDFGLLYRISRAISEQGCEIDLVLISTEGHTAIDVFHLTRRGAKLTSAEQEALKSFLQRTLEDNE